MKLLSIQQGASKNNITKYAIPKIKPFQNKIIFPIDNEVHFVPIDEFIFAFSDSNYIHIVTKGQKFFLAKTLKWLEEQIQSENIIRIHRTYLINLDEITKLDKSNWSIELTNNSTVPIARTYRTLFKGLYK